MNPVTAINDGVSEEFDNLMVRMIAGLPWDAVPPGTVSADDVAVALQHIRDHFAFIGLTETLDQSLDGLSRTLRLPPQSAPRENVTPASWAGAEQQIAAVRWDAVFRRNENDFALYDAVRQAGLVGQL